MPDFNIELDATIDRLFRACELSLSPELDDFPLKRAFAVNLYVKGDGEDTDLAFSALFEELARTLDAYGCRVIEAWRVFEGSRYQTIFCETNDPYLGGSLRERLGMIARSVHHGLSVSVRPVMVNVTAALLVGNLAITWSGGPQEASEVFHVPVQAVELIHKLHETTDGSEALFALYFTRKRDPESGHEWIFNSPTKGE